MPGVPPWSRALVGLASMALWSGETSAVAAESSDAIGDPAEPTSEEPVALQAVRGSRLGRQLRRELEASGFRVIALATASEQALQELGVARAVVVDSSGQRVWLLERVTGTGGPGGLSRRELAVDASDQLARRRVCLAVVEHLRERPATAAAPARASAPAEAEAEEAAVIRQRAAPPPAPIVPPPRARPWSLGAGTAINFQAAAGEPTGHVQLVGETELTGPLLVSLRLHWPLLGAQLHLPDRHVRLWTMGAMGGLRLRLPRLGSRLEPTAGLTGGLRFVLADTDWLDPRQSRVALAPALAGGVFVGLRYQLLALVHASFELASEWAKPFGGAQLAYEQDAAGSRTTRLALGIVFLY
jgi:hypothetical protein